MKYSQAMNPDKGVRSTRWAHWSTDIAGGSRFAPYMRTCMQLLVEHTHARTGVRLCLPHALWSTATQLVCSSAVTPHRYCGSAMLNGPSSTQTHTGCQLAPSDMPKTTVWAGSYCGDPARGKTRSEVGMQRIKRNKKKILKRGGGGDERLSHGVKKRSLRWSSVEEEATWKWEELSWSGPRDKWREFQQKNEVMMVMRSYCLLCLPMMADTHTHTYAHTLHQAGWPRSVAAFHLQM